MRLAAVNCLCTPAAIRFQESRMPGNPLVRFDEGRVGRTASVAPLLLYWLNFLFPHREEECDQHRDAAEEGAGETAGGQRSLSGEKTLSLGSARAAPAHAQAGALRHWLLCADFHRRRD